MNKFHWWQLISVVNENDNAKIEINEDLRISNIFTGRGYISYLNSWSSNGILYIIQ